MQNIQIFWKVCAQKEKDKTALGTINYLAHVIYNFCSMMMRAVARKLILLLVPVFQCVVDGCSNTLCIEYEKAVMFFDVTRLVVIWLMS